MPFGLDGTETVLPVLVEDGRRVYLPHTEQVVPGLCAWSHLASQRADTVLVAPVVTEFLQRFRHNGGCLRTSLVLEDSTASGAGVVLVVAGFRAGRGLGIGLGQSGVLLTCLRAERLIIGVQNTRLGGCGMDVAGCLIIRESICALLGKRC